MQIDGPPVDPGLQQERTALAWRRTGLAVVVGALTIGRLSIDALGHLVAVPMLLVLAAASWGVLASLRRRARVDEADGFRHVLADGRLPALVAGIVLVLCAVELLTALVGDHTSLLFDLTRG